MTNITGWIFTNCKKKNCKFYALLDMCRVKHIVKSPKDFEKPDYGCYFVGYAVKAGDVAIAGEDGGCSKVTQSYLDLLETKKSFKFPLDIQGKSFVHKNNCDNTFGDDDQLEIIFD